MKKIKCEKCNQPQVAPDDWEYKTCICKSCHDRKEDLTWKITVDAESSFIAIVETLGGTKFSAQVRFDGCVNLDLGNEESVHICDLDELIKLLTELKELGMGKFSDW